MNSHARQGVVHDTNKIKGRRPGTRPARLLFHICSAHDAVPGRIGYPLDLGAVQWHRLRSQKPPEKALFLLEGALQLLDPSFCGIPGKAVRRPGMEADHYLLAGVQQLGEEKLEIKLF